MGLPTPNTRKEQYLNAIATGNAGGLPTPITREEEYLNAIAKSGGGGGGGTTNYNALDNKPQIAGTTLQGNKSLADLGIAGDDAVEDIYAVMGEMGAKNLNKFPYKNGGAGDTWESSGITFTVNADGSVTVNGTSTGVAYFRCGIVTDNTNPIALENGKSYILSGGSTDVTVRLRNSSNVGVTDANATPVTYVCDSSENYYIIVVVGSGKTINNDVIKPMLRLASDTDDTYQQYAKTNKQLTDEIANKVDKVEGKGLSTNDYSDTEKGKVADNASAIEAIEKTYGSKNLLPLDLNVIKSLNSNATWNGNSCQLNGITFDFITDNRGAISSIEVSGTSTDYVSLALTYGGKLNVILNSDTECILSGFEERVFGGLVVYEQYYDNDWHDVAYDFNGGVFTYNTLSTVDEVRIRIDNGTAISGKAVVKPMIRDARITDPTYVPYAMTNRELTPVQQSANGVSLVKIGGLRMLNVQGSVSDVSAFQIPSADRPSSFIIGSGFISSDNDRYYKLGCVIVYADGTVSVLGADNYNTDSQMTTLSSGKFYGLATWFI